MCCFAQTARGGTFDEGLPLIPLAEPFRTILRVLVILLIAAIVLYVIVQLLGVAGINVPGGGEFRSLR